MNGKDFIFKEDGDDKITELLQDLLEKARSGEIESIAIACVSSSGDVSTGWAWKESLDTIRLSGGISLLGYRLNQLSERNPR